MAHDLVGQRDTALDGAIAVAVISLPEQMRAAAMRVAPHREMLRLDNFNPFVPFAPRTQRARRRQKLTAL